MQIFLFLFLLSRLTVVKDRKIINLSKTFAIFAALFFTFYRAEVVKFPSIFPSCLPSANDFWHKLEMPDEIWLGTYTHWEIKHFQRFELRITNSDFIPEWIYSQLPAFFVEAPRWVEGKNMWGKKLHALHITKNFGFGKALNVSRTTFNSIAMHFELPIANILNVHDFPIEKKKIIIKKRIFFVASHEWHDIFPIMSTFLIVFFLWHCDCYCIFSVIFAQYSAFRVSYHIETFPFWQTFFIFVSLSVVLLYYSLKCCFMLWSRVK